MEIVLHHWSPEGICLGLVAPAEWPKRQIAPAAMGRAALQVECHAGVSDIAEKRDHPASIQRAIVFRLVARERAYLPFGANMRELIYLLSAAETKLMLDLMRRHDGTRFFAKRPPYSAQVVFRKSCPGRIRNKVARVARLPARERRLLYDPALRFRQPGHRAHPKLGSKSELQCGWMCNKKLLEDIRLGLLVLAGSAIKRNWIADPALVSLHAMDDREARWACLKNTHRVALPVTDADGNTVFGSSRCRHHARRGAIRSHRRHSENWRSDAPCRSVSDTIRKRGGWLSALFLGRKTKCITPPIVIF